MILTKRVLFSYILLCNIFSLPIHLKKDSAMKRKDEIITFKVDRDLFEAIKDIPKRSDFIRRAVIEALGGTCPLCNGSGMLSPNQKRHWDEFMLDHSVERCGKCDEYILTCVA
jgi:hypothetical protein